MSDERNNPRIDMDRLTAAVREVLCAVGEDPDRGGLVGTPDRVARMYQELFGGLGEDPGQYCQPLFEEQYDEMVVLRDITFHSMCEHHLLPFMGVCHIAYLPRGGVVGISKLARIVNCFARRPQVQERLTGQIADLIMEKLDPKGVAVIMEAQHTCMIIRGVKKPGSVMITSALRGTCKTSPATRSEVMSLLRG
ncbi:MAG TPA: GTP cyclohydrolase I FolE [Phycisphaerae bacterium]|nr:GTP cyclohydrolase I FolE [Phycisphaerae bacterium]